MDIEVKLPQLGDGVEGGDVLTIMVKKGDTIAQDQSIMEVEVEKGTVEVPSSAAGTITEILVSEGQTISTGEVLLKVSADAGAATAAPPAAAPAAPTPPPAPAPPAPTPPPAAATPATPTPAPAPAPPMAKPVTPKPAPQPVAVKTKSGGPIPAGPAIRRFAREVGVDLATVQGSGQGGRITREDVLEVVRNGSRAAAAASADTNGIVLPGEPGQDPWGGVNIEKAPKIRRTIAAKMHESWMTVPRVTNFDDADVTELEKIRQASKVDYAEKGIKLTSMPFLIKAVSMALRDHPLINASYDQENGQVIYKRYVNVGIAVDTERGLVVPAMRNTDQKSISEIARDLASTAENMRSGSFSMDDLRGGTFTISNLGAIGGTYSTPIVNVPEVAILLVGRSRKLPVVIEDEVKIRLMMPMSLSYDHRLVDGATAARFLNDVIGFLAAPGRLLLAP